MSEKGNQRRFIDIRGQVALAKLVKEGRELTQLEQKDMALTLLQLHAGYERQRAELIRTAERGSIGPGEWYGFQADSVPMYPVILHDYGSPRWPDES